MTDAGLTDPPAAPAPTPNDHTESRPVATTTPSADGAAASPPGPSQHRIAEVADDKITLAGVDSGTDPSAPSPSRRRLQRRRLTVIVGLAIAVGLGALCGWLGYRVHQLQQETNQRAVFLQVGRQAALNLTTIDWQHADVDVDRILQSATGSFHDDFAQRAPSFVDVVKKAQSTSAGTITTAGVESASASDAQILVAVSVKTSNIGGAEQNPRYWRMRISVQRDGEEAKVSKVEFVP